MIWQNWVYFFLTITAWNVFTKAYETPSLVRCLSSLLLGILCSYWFPPFREDA